MAARLAAHFEGTLREGFRAVRSIRTLRRTWFAAFLFGAGTIPLATLVSNFFHDVYHVGATERGDIAAFLGVFGLCGIVLGGRGGAADLVASGIASSAFPSSPGWR